MRIKFTVTAIILFAFTSAQEEAKSWIRINQLGYQPNGIKVAVWCSKEKKNIRKWELVDVVSNKTVTAGSAGKSFGAYGPFVQTYRLDFSAFKKPGQYYLRAGGTTSPVFEIGDNVYKGTADFCLRYMRQQRSGFNPYLKDSCHTQDGYVLYGEKAGIKDSTHIDVVGGWHDASDYLQYSATSANATYHLLAAYRDFPEVFGDEKLDNGLDGKNNRPDVLDEAKWGLDWLSKMHPRADWLFNQIADDRDHISMRMPGQDSQYGKGYERPVYFVNGEPQQRGKFVNATTGTSSTAGKFASAFALGALVFKNEDPFYSTELMSLSNTAIKFALQKPGVTQTASVRSPYIYAEENWTDDLELAFASRAAFISSFLNAHTFQKESVTDINYLLDTAFAYAQKEKITPWLGADTANHYQWYPFINIGHYELARQTSDKKRDSLIGFYKEGIEKVWQKAKQNAFYRGVPFIWCSNNLTVSFAIQCYWYKQLTGDRTYEVLEQANFDWLFGCNPWGTSMVYGLPSRGDTPQDPHSAFTHLKNYPIDGGLVDGPVYTGIYKNLIGITLQQPDEYAAFQSALAVYHDDYGDYSTNEPTMDGTASLIYLLAAKESNRQSLLNKKVLPPSSGGIVTVSHGAIIRGDSTQKKMALVFTGHEFGEGAGFISKTLEQEKINASFFFTGDFLRNIAFSPIVDRLQKQGNYIGPHSDRHLLYCDWKKRDRLLISENEFTSDLINNYLQLRHFNDKRDRYFLPPYEWYNDSIAVWARQLGFQLISFTPGTLSHTDYTTFRDSNYRSSEAIYNSVINYEKSTPGGLNGFLLLMHVGAGPEREDKFYFHLPALIRYLKKKDYQFQTVDELLGSK